METITVPTKKPIVTGIEAAVSPVKTAAEAAKSRYMKVVISLQRSGLLRYSLYYLGTC